MKHLLGFGWSEGAALIHFRACNELLCGWPAALLSGGDRTGHWHSNIPSQVHFDLIPRAHEFSHP